MYNNKIKNKDFQKPYDDIIEGRNPVLELLESGKDINKIFINYGDRISLDKNLNKKFE